MPKFPKKSTIQPPTEVEAVTALITAEETINKFKEAAEMIKAGDSSGAETLLNKIKKETDESPFMSEMKKLDEVLRLQKVNNYVLFGLTGVALAGIGAGIYFHFKNGEGSKNGEASGMQSFV